MEEGIPTEERMDLKRQSSTAGSLVCHIEVLHTYHQSPPSHGGCHRLWRSGLRGPFYC